MLSGFAAGRSKSEFMPCKGAICEICRLGMKTEGFPVSALFDR